MKLEFPNSSHEEEYKKVIKDFGEKTSPGRLFDGDDFQNFLEIVNKDVADNENGVNSHIFFPIVDDHIVGAIQIRHHIEHPKLKEVGGHVGYGVGPSFRKKGYATEMLKLCLIECKNLGLERVLITCDDDNIGSYKTIEKNRGVFERLSKDGLSRRYWINL